eukprot:4112841-Karenia_brevis.AAC.1
MVFSDTQLYGEWNFDHLLDHNILRFISVPAANGVDCKHSVVLAPHRASEDHGWKGEPIGDHHCLVFMSRARDRF